MKSVLRVQSQPASSRYHPRPSVYAAIFRSAHLFFIIADNFLRIAGLIGLRAEAFFWAGTGFFGAAAPFCLAQLARCATAILALAAALMRRRFRPLTAFAWLAFGGRPRRAGWEPVPTRAAIACSIRLASLPKLCHYALNVHLVPFSIAISGPAV